MYSRVSSLSKFRFSISFCLSLSLFYVHGWKDPKQHRPWRRFLPRTTLSRRVIALAVAVALLLARTTSYESYARTDISYPITRRPTIIIIISLRINFSCPYIKAVSLYTHIYEFRNSTIELLPSRFHGGEIQPLACKSVKIDDGESRPSFASAHSFFFLSHFKSILR